MAQATWKKQALKAQKRRNQRQRIAANLAEQLSQNNLSVSAGPILADEPIPGREAASEQYLTDHTERAEARQVIQTGFSNLALQALGASPGLQGIVLVDAETGLPLPDIEGTTSDEPAQAYTPSRSYSFFSGSTRFAVTLTTAAALVACLVSQNASNNYFKPTILETLNLNTGRVETPLCKANKDCARIEEIHSLDHFSENYFDNAPRQLPEPLNLVFKSYSF